MTEEGPAGASMNLREVCQRDCGDRPARVALAVYAKTCRPCEAGFTSIPARWMASGVVSRTNDGKPLRRILLLLEVRPWKNRRRDLRQPARCIDARERANAPEYD